MPPESDDDGLLLDGNLPTSDGTNERLPLISVPVSVALQPSTTRNVDFGEVRAWIIAWAHEHAFNIKSVSYDGFQSTDSIQILRRLGFRAWNDSVDRTMEPYIDLRKALLEGRVGFHEFPLL